MATMTAREFNQDVGAAKRAALGGPVVVTDRGRPAFVLLSIEEYRRLTAPSAEEFLARLRMDSDDEVDFEPARLDVRIPDL